MIVNNEKFRFSITEALSLIGTVLYLIGIRAWFPVCAVNGDTIMACHWAGQMLKAISVLAVVLSIIHIVMKDRTMKAGMDISLIGIYIVMLFVPGRIINVCMKAEMMCRKLTMPCTMAFAAVLIILTAADAFYYHSQEINEKHKRA